MKRMSKKISIFIAVLLLVSMVFVSCTAPAQEPAAEEPAAEEPAAEEPAAEEPAAEEPAAEEPAAEEPAAEEPAAEEPAADVDWNGEFDEVLTLGINDTMTGTGAVYGVPQVNAINIAIDEINEAGGVLVDGKHYEIQTIVYDNKGDPNEAVAALRKLVDRDGIKLVLGWGTSGATMAVAQMMGEEDALMLVATAGELSITTQGFDNVLRIRPPGAYTGGPAGEFLYNQGERTVALLGQLKDPLREQYTGKLKEKFEEMGGEIVAMESYEETDRDMYTQLSKIMDIDPDALFVAGHVESVAFAVRQARELGFEKEIYCFSGGSKEQFLTVMSEEQLEGLWDILPVEGNVEALGEVGEKYNNKYIELHGENPPPGAIYGYDAVYALKAGLEAANTVDDIDAIAEAMRSMPVADGVAMEYLTINDNMFDQNGQSYIINIAVQWRDGERHLVEKLKSDPTEFSEYMTELSQETIDARG